jgi:hypothetical protein
MEPRHVSKQLASHLRHTLDIANDDISSLQQLEPQPRRDLVVSFSVT